MERLRSLSQLPDAHLDNNFFYAVDHLCTAVEAMNMMLNSIDVHRQMFANPCTDEEIRRRWAVHMNAIKSMFMNVDLKVEEVRQRTRKLLAMD